jgi:asparagine synthase (glutamine-hydrolysing)
MCGILAVNSSTQSSDITRSLNRISHRGPDDRGTYISDDRQTALGHVRLSIIDLSSLGHQPMESLCGRFVISFNGEIYNYQELRQLLETKHGRIPWRSTSDTEIIIEGFANEGYKFLSSLNGIFTIAVYDKREKDLYVLRDPIGVKPLYWTKQNSSIYFCSEIKGLIEFEELTKTIRRQSLADQLSYMYVPEPYTMYEEFFKVLPGYCYRIKDGEVKSQEYIFSHLHEAIHFRDEDEMIASFGDCFSSAVKRQLAADVPVSLFLSGGLDSSAVAYEAVAHSSSVKTAYTISYSKKDNRHDQQSDDLFYARKMADVLNLQLHVIDADSNFLHMLPELSDFLEDGICDPAAINTNIICAHARKEGVKVLLSGQGADEYLCGYRRYKAESILNKMPGPLRKALSVADKGLPASVPGRFNSTFRRIKKISQAAGRSQVERLTGYFIWDDPTTIKTLFADNKTIEVGADISAFFTTQFRNDSLEAMLKADQQFDLMSLNLSYTDKMSMKEGVEVRVPFLDFELVKLMNSVPVSMKLRGGVQKYILKKAMEPKLPHEVIYREKAGFALPIRSWLKDPQLLGQYFDSSRIGAQGIYSPVAIEQLLRSHLNGKADHTHLLFALLCQQYWLDKNEIKY